MAKLITLDSGKTKSDLLVSNEDISFLVQLIGEKIVEGQHGTIRERARENSEGKRLKELQEFFYQALMED